MFPYKIYFYPFTSLVLVTLFHQNTRLKLVSFCISPNHLFGIFKYIYLSHTSIHILSFSQLFYFIYSFPIAYVVNILLYMLSNRKNSFICQLLSTHTVFSTPVIAFLFTSFTYYFVCFNLNYSYFSSFTFQKTHFILYM